MLPEHPRVCVVLAAGEPVRLAPRPGFSQPLVQQLAASAERLLERLVRARDVAVERRRDIADQPGHLASFGLRVRRRRRLNIIAAWSRSTTCASWHGRCRARRWFSFAAA